MKQTIVNVGQHAKYIKSQKFSERGGLPLLYIPTKISKNLI